MGVTSKVYQIVFTSNPAGALAGFDAVTNRAKRSKTDLQKWGVLATGTFYAASAGAAVFAAHGVKSFLDFDQAMSKSISIMDNVDETMRNKLEKTARDVGKTTRFSATEAANAMFFLASANYSAEKTMATIPLITKFATAAYVDMETAATELIDSQAALGMASDDVATHMKNMTRISDVLTKANQLSNAEISDFAEALQNKSAGAMRAFGVSLEEGTAALAIFAEKGVKGELAGEALNITLRDLGRAAHKNEDEWRKLGVAVFDADGTMRSLPDIMLNLEQRLGGMSDKQKVAAFEAMGLNRGVANQIRTLMGSAEKMKAYENALKGAAGTTDIVANKSMDNFKDKLTVIKGKVTDVAMSLGEVLVNALFSLEPAIENYIAWMKEDIIPSLQEWWRWMDEKVNPELGDMFDKISKNKKVMATLTAFFSALAVSGAVASIAKVAGSLGFLVGPLAWVANLLGTVLVGAVTAGAAALGVSVGVFLLIIAAVVAAGVAIWYFRDEIVAFGKAAWEWLVKLWDDKIFPALEAAGRFFVRLGGIIADAWEWIVEKVRDFWEEIKPLREDFGHMWDSIAEGVGGFIKELQETWDEFWTWWEPLWGKISDAWTQINDDAEPVFNVLVGFFKSFKDMLTQYVTDPLNVLVLVFRTVFGIIIDMLGPSLDYIFNMISSVFTAAFNIVSTILGSILRIIGDVFTIISNTIQFFLNILQGDWGEAWENIKNIVGAVWDAINTSISGAIEILKEIIRLGWDNIANVASLIWEGIKAIVVNVWEGIQSGIRSAIGRVVGIINTLIDGVNDIIDILPGDVRPIPEIPWSNHSPGNKYQSNRDARNDTGRFAQGGALPSTDINRSGPFVTSGARAIVGEGNPSYPEYVIPTDPKFRNRALGLFEALGGKLMAKGGVVSGAVPMLAIGGNPLGEAWDAAKDVAGDVAGAIRRGGVNAMFKPLEIAFNAGIRAVPWDVARATAIKAKDDIKDFLKGEDAKLPEESAGGNVNWSGSAGVEQWRDVALQALAEANAPASWIGSLLRRMNQESGGNPNAVNNWDINAARGTPSKGLMQTIQSTFNAYAGRFRSRGIFDPLANIFASINYANARYGSAPRGWDRPGGYFQGGQLPAYDTGAWNIRKAHVAEVHPEERILPPNLAELSRKEGIGGKHITINHLEVKTISDNPGKDIADELDWLWRVAG